MNKIFISSNQTYSDYKDCMEFLKKTKKIGIETSVQIDGIIVSNNVIKSMKTADEDLRLAYCDALAHTIMKRAKDHDLRNESGKSFHQ